MKKTLIFFTSIFVILVIIILNLDTIRSIVVQRLNEQQKQSIREIFLERVKPNYSKNINYMEK